MVCYIALKRQIEPEWLYCLQETHLKHEFRESLKEKDKQKIHQASTNPEPLYQYQKKVAFKVIYIGGNKCL